MKRAIILAIAIFCFGVPIVYSYTSPGKPQGFVSDFAGIIPNQKKTILEQKLSDLNRETSIQISIVIIKYLIDETIETYAVKLFEEWGIGQKGKDNGVLLLVALNDREVRIEVGYGLEGVLTDAQSNGIIQKIIIPEFKNGNMEDGINKGVDAIISVVKSEADYSIQQKSTNKFNSDWIFFIVFIFMWLTAILGRTKSWWLGGLIGGIIGIFLGIIWIVILAIVGFIFDFIVSKAYAKSKLDGRDPPWWIGGGWGGGGHGGGFGGFGGGMSGGGGASGRW